MLGWLVILAKLVQGKPLRGVYQYKRTFLLGALLKYKFWKKTYLIVIKDETGLKFKINDSTLFLIGSYAQKLVASY